MISRRSLAARLDGLEHIGTGAGEGVDRLAWSPQNLEWTEWFQAQADAAGLIYRRDPAGNLWAVPTHEPPWWGLGSHLDSVRSGGRFDGALGVACAFEIAAAVPGPVAVISFAEEEGARYNTPTFGSKALVGRLDVPRVLMRRDEQDVALADAMRAVGVDPDLLHETPQWLARLHGFIEVHVDQSTDLAKARQPIGIVSSLAGRIRLEVDLRGRADHAGTTPPADRRDALGTAARLIVAAEQSAADFSALTVTAPRILAEPNAPSTIASHVRLWLDARSREDPDIERWLSSLRHSCAELSAATRVGIGIEVASRSEGRAFSSELSTELARAGEELLGEAPPSLVCYAGHDAGVLAERIPAAMVLVRNETGVSHSPEEAVDLEDAVIAADIVAQAIGRLAARR